MAGTSSRRASWSVTSERGGRMNQLIYVTQEALFLVLIASAPPILLSLLVGFLISVFQATTQIQAQTLTFAPKVVVVFGVLALTGSWIGAQLLRFTSRPFDPFPALIHCTPPISSARSWPRRTSPSSSSRWRWSSRGPWSSSSLPSWVASRCRGR